MFRHALLLAAASGVGAQTIVQNSVTLNTRACQGSFAALPFCNTSLSLDERVDDLIERIWSTNQSVIPALLTARNFGSSAMPLLGVPEYDWGLNSIHGNDGAPVWCTASQPQVFFSHRRDSRTLGQSGRMAACIWLGA